MFGSTGTSAPTLALPRDPGSPRDPWISWGGTGGGSRAGERLAHGLDRCWTAGPGLEGGRALCEEHVPAVDAAEAKLPSPPDQGRPAPRVDQIDDGTTGREGARTQRHLVAAA